ncbi:hypothetical protein B0T17DRAFT_618312 [Bombardia bombarda]|uniref:Uncharacterized protein n=1 Tax=Bombardia bombarda TaxID=252184 RepID=A0AA40C209_9PEZI|nr:hypothetical protein B0T17DRAFT_618312 [Bombardia bombarda]
MFISHCPTDFVQIQIQTRATIASFRRLAACLHNSSPNSAHHRVTKSSSGSAPPLFQPARTSHIPNRVADPVNISARPLKMDSTATLTPDRLLAAEDHPDLSSFPDSLRGKRILLCTESFGPVNGVSRTTLMLVNHLRANGAVVAVVAPHNHTKQNTFIPLVKPPAAINDNNRSFNQNDIELRIRGYPLPFNPELSIVYPFRLSTLYKQTFGHPPDLIYLASPASLGFQVMLQLRQQPAQSQIPIICNFQTDLAGYCAILFPPPLSDLAVLAFSAVQAYLFRHASVKTVFYPSRFVRRYLEGNKVQRDKMKLLQRGVDTRLFHPGKRNEVLRREIAPGGEVILICVARLAGEKGFGFLADVAAALDDRRVEFKLVIVGGNRNRVVEEEVRALFALLVKKGRVVFVGFKMGEALAEMYASCDVFLHCSVTETFGLVVLESMASGVPVVARDEGGPSDIVRERESGFLVPPGDLGTFVNRVVLLIEDEEVRMRMAKEGRKQAEGATWERVNNRVALRMAEVIEEREREGAEVELGTGAERNIETGVRTSRMVMSTTPMFGWLLLNGAIRERIVDVRLAAGMAVIAWFWIAVSLYLAFIETAQWLKARLRTWS